MIKLFFIYFISYKVKMEQQICNNYEKPMKKAHLFNDLFFDNLKN
jgi:hypothetical protein